MTKSVLPLSQTLAPEAVLLATMPPLPDESCASWIQRMAGDHQYSMNKLMQILDVHTSHRDWDLPIPLAAWLRILAVAGIRYLRYGYSPRVLSVLTTHIEPAKLFLHSAGRPHYRWCAQCLASDRVPYLRWYWRLRLVETCELHRVALWQVCPMCSEPLWMDSSRLVAHGAQGLALDLAHCDRCGMPLHDEREQPRVRASRVDKLIRHSLKPLMAPWFDLDAESIARVVIHFVHAAGLKNALRSRPPTCLEFGTDVVVSKRLIGTPFGVAAAYARAAANAARLRSAPDQSGRWTLNAVSFRPSTAEPQGSNAPIVRWSWRLGAERRLMLARALRTIRREKRES
ncbi:TniQ family protein [Variovorax sp. VaC1]|uniref:TniQ family protein n=1 Tax=Variovorax sp. VaC1 TaxID=3373132 RepID=UPI003749DAE9